MVQRARGKGKQSTYYYIYRTIFLTPPPPSFNVEHLFCWWKMMVGTDRSKFIKAGFFFSTQRSQLMALCETLSFFLSFFLCFFVSLFLSIFLTFFLSFFLSFFLTYFLSFFLSFFLSLFLSFSLSLFLSFSLSLFLSLSLSLVLLFFYLFSCFYLLLPFIFHFYRRWKKLIASILFQCWLKNSTIFCPKFSRRLIEIRLCKISSNPCPLSS